MLAWVLLFLGCDEQTAYAERYASANCQLLQDCDLLLLYGYYDHGGRSAWQVCEENLREKALSADWRQEDAETCVESVEAQDCEDLYSQGIPQGCTDWLLD